MTTKERIKQELLKLLEIYPADDITLKLFTAEAGISKQTLYNHYYCLMDALEDAYKSDLNEALAHCNTYHDWVEGFDTLLKFFKSHSQICLHLYYSSRKDDFMNMIETNGVMMVKRGIEECASDMEIEVSEKDRIFMLRFYMHVFMGIITDYFNGKLKEEPEYISSRSDAMMRHHIRNTLKNIRDMEKGEF